jgi:hypothetical protein
VSGFPYPPKWGNRLALERGRGGSPGCGLCRQMLVLIAACTGDGPSEVQAPPNPWVKAAPAVPEMAPRPEQPGLHFIDVGFYDIPIGRFHDVQWLSQHSAFVVELDNRGIGWVADLPLGGSLAESDGWPHTVEVRAGGWTLTPAPGLPECAEPVTIDRRPGKFLLGALPIYQVRSCTRTAQMVQWHGLAAWRATLEAGVLAILKVNLAMGALPQGECHLVLASCALDRPGFLCEDKARTELRWLDRGEARRHVFPLGSKRAQAVPCGDTWNGGVFVGDGHLAPPSEVESGPR